MDGRCLEWLLDSLEEGEVEWLGASFDGGYRLEQGAIGYELLFHARSKQFRISQSAWRVSANKAGSFEAEAIAVSQCCLAVSRLLRQIWTIERVV